MELAEFVERVKDIQQEDVELLKHLVSTSSEVFIIGNGGSNAIASHMAIDYTKFLGKKCYVPNSGDMLSMLVNDYGYEQSYAKFIEYNYSRNNQLAILISSSGNSKNIINAAYSCAKLKIPTILLSGFSKDNSLNTITSDNIKMRYWVDSKNYGVVELVHHTFLHCIV